MSRKKHIAPYLILWRIKLEHKPMEQNWTVYDSFNSLAIRNRIYDSLLAKQCQIVEYKRETNHNSHFINPTISYEQSKNSN